MARPTITAIGEIDDPASNDLTVSITAPTEGNTLMLTAHQDGADSTFTPPAGWTSVVHLTPPTVQCVAEIWIKTAGASEPTSIQVTSSRTDAFGLSVCELDNSAALDDETPPTANADSGAPNPPAATPVDGETLCVPVLVCDRDTIGSATMTNYTNVVSLIAGSSTDRATLQVWSRALTGTAEEDPPAISTGDDNWAAVTLLWKDGSGAPTGYPSQYYDYTIVGSNPGVM